MLNGRNYIPFTELRTVISSASSTTSSVTLFGYRIGTIIKRVFLGGGAFTGSIGASWYRTDSAGNNRFFGQVIPIVTELAGSGVGTNQNEMSLPQEIVEDGQTFWGIDLRAGGSVSSAFTQVKMVVNGWMPV